MTSLSTAEIIRIRLQSQRLSALSGQTVAGCVQHMGALQAQDYGQAVWGLGLRVGDTRLADIESALAKGDILRTWPMRGTVHFVPARDAGWMLALGAARMIAADKRRLDRLELDEATLQACEKVARHQLQGRVLLSRPALLQCFEDAKISTKGGRGYHILWRLSQAGMLCIGPMVGKQQGFALLHEWVPRQRELGRDEALAELCRRYFISHGPATVADFAWWSGLTLTECRAALHAVAGELMSANAKNGATYWFAEPQTPQSHGASKSFKQPSLLLLPGFDEYFLGYRDRSAFTDPQHISYIVPGNNGIFKPIIVMNGRVVGVWQRKIHKSSVDIALMPFDKISDLPDRALPAASDYAKFIGLPLKLSVDT